MNTNNNYTIELKRNRKIISERLNKLNDKIIYLQNLINKAINEKYPDFIINDYNISLNIAKNEYKRSFDLYKSQNLI